MTQQTNKCSRDITSSDVAQGLKKVLDEDMTTKESLREKFINEFPSIEGRIGLMACNSIVDFFWNKMQKEMEGIEKILDRHVNWKPTEGFESDEECGYQKGIIAETALINSEILAIIKQSHE